ncbi:VOC family protein [Pleionea sp. CnH1-48]|uniref:VOC family protein n=1 Tax=Pleionea sp. CnH1-48 TaxID=2954494 RepID=UPI00209862C5|nr:VOC family protein [Pleionea sp. CnH1-48]MCO7226964.1 VOC family protein [Pleionea sp. CnH1-48]
MLVLRCKDIHISKAFYEKLGLSFQLEKHGGGPKHYATQMDGLVLELYPLKTESDVSDIRLGLSVSYDGELLSLLKQYDIEVTSINNLDGSKSFVVEDPDGRKIELT